MGCGDAEKTWLRAWEVCGGRRFRYFSENGLFIGNYSVLDYKYGKKGLNDLNSSDKNDDFYIFIGTLDV